MSDEITHRLSTEGVDPLALAGVNDGNLVALAQRLGVRVSLRGDTLMLHGPLAAVERACRWPRRSSTWCAWARASPWMWPTSTDREPGIAGGGGGGGGGGAGSGGDPTDGECKIILPACAA